MISSAINKSKTQKAMYSLEITFESYNISLTDIAREENAKSHGYLVQFWLHSSNNVQYLLFWQKAYNPEFLDDECSKLIENIRTIPITLTSKSWINTTNTIDIKSRAGKNGCKMAHLEIAQVFRAWIFPEVMLKMVKTFND